MTSSTTSLARPLRPIRSYVLRQGRTTPAQHHALQNYWSQYGLPLSHNFIDKYALFGRIAPLIVEIGFGMGHSLFAQAHTQLNHDFIGIEVHRPGVGSLLTQIHQAQLTNVRICCDDAHAVLTQIIPDNYLAKIQIFFPDPWPKKRHHKRRLIQAPFIDLLAKKLQPEGILHVATDWQEYAESILDLLNQSSQFNNTAPNKKFSLRPIDRPVTKFEQRGKKLGHGVWDLIFQKKS